MGWSYPPGEAINLTSAGASFTRGVVSGAANEYCVLAQVNIGTAAASAVLTLYTGASTTGSKFATIDCSSTTGRAFVFGSRHRGLYGQLTGGNADVTVIVV